MKVSVGSTVQERLCICETSTGAWGGEMGTCFSSAILLFLNLICRLVQLCTYLFLMDQVCQVMLLLTALVNKMSLAAYSFLWWFFNGPLTRSVCVHLCLCVHACMCAGTQELDESHFPVMSSLCICFATLSVIHLQMGDLLVHLPSSNF